MSLAESLETFASMLDERATFQLAGNNPRNVVLGIKEAMLIAGFLREARDVVQAYESCSAKDGRPT